LERGADIYEFYRDLGRGFKRAFQGWTIAFIAPDEHLARATGLEVQIRAQLSNGGIAVALYTTSIPPFSP
jgi:23S rRNA G2445 N2-methylase RlmL